MTISGFTLNNGATATASSMTGTVPSTVAVGDVMVVVSSQNTGVATHTISGGGGVTWHLQSGPDDNSSNERTYVWTATATASSASSTVQVSSSASGRLIGAGWTGSGLTETGLVLGLHSVTTSGTSMVFPSVTVTAAGSTLVALAVMRTGTTTAATLTAPAGCTVDATSMLAFSTASEFTAVSLHETATVGTGSQSPGTGTASVTIANAQLYTLAFPASATGTVAASGTGTVTAGGTGSATASGASATGMVTVGGSATPTGTVSAAGIGTITADGSGTPTLPPPPVQFLPLPPMEDQQRLGLTVAVYDTSYTLQGYVNDYESAQATFQHLDVGTGTLVLSETHPLVPTFNLAGQQVVPVTVTDRFGHRWTGRVDKVSTDDGDGSTHAVPGAGLMTVTLIDEWTWFKRLLASPFGPDPRLGYVTGDTEFDTRTGPIETVAKSYISDALTRVYGGAAPFAVIPAPAVDPSVVVTFQAKWTPLADLLAETLRTYSWALTITLWLPGDVQPVGLVAPLSTPTLVVDMHHGADNAWIVWDDDTFLTRKVGVQAPVSCGAVVGGSGTGTTQTFYSYSNPDLHASQGLFGFPEQYLSSSNATDPTTDAAVQFAKTSGSLGVEASVEEGVPWSYGGDFMVGDVVGLRALGLDVRERVTAVQMVDDRANGYRLVPTIGEDTATLTPLAALFRTSRELGSRISSIETGN